MSTIKAHFPPRKLEFSHFKSSIINLSKPQIQHYINLEIGPKIFLILSGDDTIFYFLGNHQQNSEQAQMVKQKTLQACI